MSTVNNGPQIVRSGLILNLDAGNGKSYSTNRFQSLGSGTVTENVTFPIQGTGTFQRVASGTVIGGYTVRPNDVVYSYALGVNGCHYHGNSAPVIAGSYATFSFDYLVTGATNYPSTDYLANFEGVAGASIGIANTVQNVWQRRSFTVGPISTSGNLNMYLYPGACGATRLADTGTIYYRNPKVELTNTDTGNSTFSATSNIGLWYDLSGNGYNGTLTNGPTSNVSNKGNILFDGSDDNIQLGNASTFLPTSGITINSWAKTNVTGVYKKLFVTVTSGLSTITGIYFSLGPSPDNIYLGVITNNGNQYATSTTNPSTSLFSNFCGTYDGANIKLYLNGALIATKAQTGTIVNTGIGRISGYDSNTEVWNGNIATFSIYNRALSAAEISQNYEATRTKFGL
jgi:hypothetical protein